MKKAAVIFLMAWILFGVGIAGSAQVGRSEILDRIAGKLVRDIRGRESEFLFTHVDKPFCLAGTTIWFRVYLQQFPSTKLSTYSKLVFVDLVDRRDSAVGHLVLNAAQMQLNGGMPVPASLSSGQYYLRFYTPGFRIRDTGNIFIYPVYIKNPEERIDPDSRASLVRPFYLDDNPYPLVRIVPEGKMLVSGVDNLVVIRANDANGLPVSLSGYVKDSRDTIVARFQTNSQGLGKFILNPYRNRRYSANFSFEGSGTQSVDLGSADNNAFQLSLVQRDSGKIKLRVSLGDSAYLRKATSYLLGVSKEKLVFASYGSGMYEVAIPMAQLPYGLTRFYLFNDQEMPVSTRDVWINRSDPVISIRPDKEKYFARSTVKLDIDIKDLAGNGLASLLSVSVTDNRVIPSSSAELSPVDYALLNRQIPGLSTCGLNLSDPSMLDLLLIASADTLQRMNTDALNLSQEDTALSIRGTLYQGNGQPITNQPVVLFSTQRNLVLSDSTDGRGRFSFRNLDFYDSTQFAVQLPKSKFDLSTVSLKLDPVSDRKLPSFPENKKQPCISGEPLSALLEKYLRGYFDTVLTGKSIRRLEQLASAEKTVKKTSGDDKNRFSRRITREQLSKKSLSTTADAVKMIPGVMMMNGKLTIRGGIQSFGGDASPSGNIEPLVVVDGVPAGNVGSVEAYINSIPPEQIDYIEVLTGPEAAFFGTRGGNGVIVIKTGQPVNEMIQKENMISIYPKGYHLSPPFFLPPYESEKVKEDLLNDNRSTIYWNGDIQTDSLGKAAVRFFTADAKSAYTVTVMGITAGGELLFKQVAIRRE